MRNWAGNLGSTTRPPLATNSRRPDGTSVQAVLPAIESALEPFGPRPHCATLFAMRPEVLRSRDPRMADFSALARSLDPGGKVRNAFVERCLFG
jgi:xylitol oxidase